MRRALLLCCWLVCGCATASVRSVPQGYARLSLSCPDEKAEVTVDGAPAGTAGDYRGGRGRLLLKPGWHHIELRGESGTAVREAQLGAGDDVALVVQLTRGGS